MRAILTLLVLLTALTVRAEPLRVAAIYGVTGFGADLGTEFQRGAQMFLQSSPDSILSVAFENSEWNPRVAVSAYRKLHSLSGLAVVHVLGSGPALALKPLIERDRVLLMAAAAHPDLLRNRFIIRHGNLASEDAQALAREMSQRGITRISALYLENEWGQTYESSFKQTLQATRPLDYAADSHPAESVDFRTSLLRLLGKRPEAFVVMTSGPACAASIKQLRTLGYSGPIFLNNGLSLSRASQDELRGGDYGEIYYQAYPPTPAKFSESYRQRFREVPEYFAVVSYTDMELLDYVSTLSPSLEAMDLAETIRRLGRFKGEYADLDISPEGDILIPTSVRKWGPAQKGAPSSVETVTGRAANKR